MQAHASLSSALPVVVLASTLAGCAAGEPAPAVTRTATVEVPAALPSECAEAFAEAEALLQQSSELADAWQVYATGPMVELVAGTATAESVVIEHQKMVDSQTAFAEAVAASRYADLKAACLAAGS